MKKRLIALICIFAMILTLSACGDDKSEGSKKKDKKEKEEVPTTIDIEGTWEATMTLDLYDFMTEDDLAELSDYVGDKTTFAAEFTMDFDSDGTALWSATDAQLDDFLKDMYDVFTGVYINYFVEVGEMTEEDAKAIFDEGLPYEDFYDQFYPEFAGIFNNEYCYTHDEDEKLLSIYTEGYEDEADDLLYEIVSKDEIFIEDYETEDMTVDITMVRK